MCINVAHVLSWNFLGATALLCLLFITARSPLYSHSHSFARVITMENAYYLLDAHWMLLIGWQLLGKQLTLWPYGLSMGLQESDTETKQPPQWTVAHQAPLPMGFSRQEHWSVLTCLPPRLFCPVEVKAQLYMVLRLRDVTLLTVYTIQIYRYSASSGWVIGWRRKVISWGVMTLDEIKKECYL